MLRAEHNKQPYRRPFYLDRRSSGANRLHYAELLAQTLPVVVINLDAANVVERRASEKLSVEQLVAKYEHVRHRLLEKKFSDAGLSSQESMLLTMINAKFDRLVQSPLRPAAKDLEALAEAKRLIFEARRGATSTD